MSPCIKLRIRSKHCKSVTHTPSWERWGTEEVRAVQRSAIHSIENNCCHIMSYHTISYYIMSNYTVLNRKLYLTIPCHAMPYCTISWHLIPVTQSHNSFFFFSLNCLPDWSFSTHPLFIALQCISNPAPSVQFIQPSVQRICLTLSV